MHFGCFLWSRWDNCRCYLYQCINPCMDSRKTHPDWRIMMQMGPKTTCLSVVGIFMKAPAMWYPPYINTSNMECDSRKSDELQKYISPTPSSLQHPFPRGGTRLQRRWLVNHTSLRHSGTHQCHPPLYPLHFQVVDICIWTLVWSKREGAFQHPSGVSTGVKAQQCLLCWLHCLWLVHSELWHWPGAEALSPINKHWQYTQLGPPSKQATAAWMCQPLPISTTRPATASRSLAITNGPINFWFHQ